MEALIADKAHAAGVAIAQKNSAEMLSKKEVMKTDFVMVEECNMYDECQEYIDAYGIQNVVAVEYNKGAFTKGCNQFPKLALVFRDQNLVAKGDEGYQFSLCGSSS